MVVAVSELRNKRQSLTSFHESGDASLALFGHRTHQVIPNPVGLKLHHALLLAAGARIIASAVDALREPTLSPSNQNARRGSGVSARVAAAIDGASCATVAEITRAKQWACERIESSGSRLVTAHTPRLAVEVRLHPAILGSTKQMEQLSKRMTEAVDTLCERRKALLAQLAGKITRAASSRHQPPLALADAAAVAGAACSAVVRVWEAVDEAAMDVAGSVARVGVTLVQHCAGDAAGAAAQDLVSACERVKYARWALEEVVEVSICRPQSMPLSLGQTTAARAALEVLDKAAITEMKAKVPAAHTKCLALMNSIDNAGSPKSPTTMSRSQSSDYLDDAAAAAAWCMFPAAAATMEESQGCSNTPDSHQPLNEVLCLAVPVHFLQRP